MSVATYTPVTANGDSAVVDLGSSAAAFVDLFIPNILNVAPEHDGGDLTFKYSIDGTNYKAVPGMTVADNENGYKGRFLVWGNNLKYTAANLAGSAATVAPSVRIQAASMVQAKSSWSFLSDTGVLNADSGSEKFSFGRVADMILLDAEASTWDSVDMVIQGSTDGTNWFDLDGTHATVNDQYLVFNNPSKLTNFRLEWSGGGLSAAGMAITVIGLTNADEPGIKKNANVLGTVATVMTDAGTPEADGILDDVTATPTQTLVNNNFATVVTEVNRIGADVARIVECLQGSAQLPQR
jgi:hypothetical protein